MRSKVFQLHDGRMSPGEMLLALLVFVSYNAFYDRPFSEKDKTPPACFALNQNPKELVPSETSPDKQSEACDGCPNNEFGSKGAGKACGNHRLLAVVEPGPNPDSPILLIQTAPTSVKHWDAYASAVVAKFGMTPIGVLTEIYFDPDQEYPTLRFGNPVPNPDVAVHLARQPAALKRLMTEPDVSQYAPPPATKAPARKAR
jgi:hypothetical protein